MGIEIFHQLGFRETWNFDCHNENKVGEGFIISPRSMKASKVEGLKNTIKEISIFDPQIVNPHEMNKNMETFDIFPLSLMSDGFDTRSYSEYADEFAEKCANYQIRHNFKNIIIPTRFFYDIPPVEDFIDYQTEIFINPFMKILDEKKTDKEIILQLYLNSQILKNKEYRFEILDWVTGLKTIRGIYLITEITPRKKQIDDPVFLISVLEFIDALNQNGLSVILGYSNTELILYTLANPSILTVGSYENVRIFNSNMFKDMNVKKDLRSPNARLFAPQLLDWIEYPYIQFISDRYPEKLTLFGNSEYLNIMLKPDYIWSSAKPEIYKHYFVEISKQVQQISLLEEKERFRYIHQLIKTAMREFSEIEQLGIDLGQAGSHLPKWMTVANQFAKDKGWL